ncbi:ASCC3-like protein [Mya arenaria]|uniref:ASCC3-like protein n=1 Tax=Mya arenaria TaxID=6604 RepID=A0ABY7EEH9_MYAAR|nr:ASCC3-like protein [Mya arenaria]
MINIMPASMSGLPRLSGALRVYTGLSTDTGSSHTHDSSELLRKRQLVTKKKTTVEGSSWQRVQEKIRAASSLGTEELTAAFKDLTQCARQIAGDGIDADVADGAAVYLLGVFKKTDKVGQKETGCLKSVFGPFPASVATKACALVSKLTSSMPDEVVASLGTQEREEGDGAATVCEFGQGIKFSLPSVVAKDTDLSSSDSEEEERREVNLQYTASETKPRSHATGGESMAPETERGLDAAWLQQEVGRFYGTDGSTELGLSLEDLSSTIYDFLFSTKSDSELQNDLFELLGFDRFELIQSLLENRQKLLYVATHEPEAHKLAARPKLEGSSKPAYGCQVVIQSEQERVMLKQLRREEKRQEKQRGGRGEDGGESAGFNPADLRAHREAALQMAAVAPRFSGRAGTTGRERYPNVYDKMEEARLSSAFIGGMKMALPDTLTRENNKIYEEVNIPPSDNAPTHVGENRVRIETLDEIAQMAFKNTKALNRIQSVVFETAYKTNENLLICAPTGAGKTNIAMLTILHEIQQHLAQGVIKKDEFKIIYVAPMKALAAEMVRNFGGRLEPLGISVRELTGDMSLTKSEILKTQMLVTTPEKWDVVTRKSTGDVALAQLVKLLIIDEVHLLHEDRGAVIECLVARTLRQVESSQSMIRIVGLSATLPNYLDVARFLHVNPYLGLFFFDGRFRPVPLGMAFIGIKALNRVQQMQDFNTVCYEKVLYQVKRGYQVMVFVHARNETVRTASVLRDHAKNNGDIQLFLPQQCASLGDATKTVMKSRNKQLKELFSDGFSIHHAGMLRQDRNVVERYFAAGHIKVLGTQIYNAKKGAFVDLGILDVMQIFGRAGRPQFDTFGHGTIITTHDKLSHYLSLMTRQNPIESQFINSLTDNLNAEVALGTVTNVDEAVRWISYTYFIEEDPTLNEYRRDLVIEAGRKLDKARMVRFDEGTGYFYSTDQGRVSSHFYIKYDTVEVINEFLKTVMTEADIFALVSKAQEFDQIKVRDEEMEELEGLLHHECEMQVPGGVENSYGKVNILLQSYVSRHYLDSFSLVSDQSYVAQNAARITRSLFEICLKKGWPIMASRLLNLSKTIDKRIWGFETPLRQFSILTQEVITKIEGRKLKIDKLRDMDAKEIGHMLHHVKMGSVVKRCVHQLPSLDLDATIQPITRTVLRVRLVITPSFNWDDKMYQKDPSQVLVFTIPIFEPLPTQYYVKAISDRWLGSESVCAISFQHLILPERHPPHTELLDLQPLPVTALMNPMLETLYKFTHFNPIQTQLFHVLYHSDHNVLLGAPTGSGKTIAAELAIFRLFRERPKDKAVYIAPLKALVRERMEDWKVRIEQKLGKKYVV